MQAEFSPAALIRRLSALLHSAGKASTSNTPSLLVAYSGGLDSHVLLHALAQASAGTFALRAIYIDHGLQAQSAAWASHCARQCEQLHIPFKNIALNLHVPSGASVEEVARNARYQALKQALLPDEALLTAQHQSDQAETLLLQLFRGAGANGLAAMPSIATINSPHGSHLHLRPLLEYPRAALEAYSNKHQLHYIEDPSNQDTRFDRNFIRHQLMPHARKRWPSIDKTIARAASLQAENKQLLDELAAQTLPNVLSPKLHHWRQDTPQHPPLAPLNINALSTFSKAKQRLLLRYWISQQGFKLLSEAKLQHIFTDLIHAAADKQPLITWHGTELRRFQQHLYIMPPLAPHDASQVFAWSMAAPLTINSLGITLSPSLLPEPLTHISVRFRQGGEQINDPKRGTLSLKNLLQEHQVPPWMRSRLPLLFHNAQLIKVIGIE